MENKKRVNQNNHVLSFGEKTDCTIKDVGEIGQNFKKKKKVRSLTM